MIEEEIYTPKEVAARLKLSEKTVLEYLREGKLAGFKIGKHWRIRASDLESLIRPSLQIVEPATQEDR